MSKLINFNKDYKVTSSSIRGSISNLILQITTAIKQQSYIHKDPDGNITPEDLLAMQNVFLNIVTEFSKLSPMVDDMVALHTEQMTVDELIEKYTVDVPQYSLELEDAPIDWK